MPHAGAAALFSYQGSLVTDLTRMVKRIDTIATDIKVTTIQAGIVETDSSTVTFSF